MPNDRPFCDGVLPQDGAAKMIRYAARSSASMVDLNNATGPANPGVVRRKVRYQRDFADSAVERAANRVRVRNADDGRPRAPVGWANKMLGRANLRPNRFPAERRA